MAERGRVAPVDVDDGRGIPRCLVDAQNEDIRFERPLLAATIPTDPGGPVTDRECRGRSGGDGLLASANDRVPDRGHVLGCFATRERFEEPGLRTRVCVDARDRDAIRADARAVRDAIAQCRGLRRGHEADIHRDHEEIARPVGNVQRPGVEGVPNRLRHSRARAIAHHRNAERQRQRHRARSGLEVASCSRHCGSITLAPRHPG